MPPDPEHIVTDETYVIVAGAAPLSAEVVAHLPAGARIIAADSGADHALAAGLHPEVVIGDLDSISAEGLAWARAHAEIEAHPSHKDRTDTELALAHAAAHHPERIILLSGGGDRLDHTFAAFGALGAPYLAGVPHLECWWAAQFALVLHGPSRTQRHLTPGSPLSLLALHGPCRGVSLTGTRWELHEAELAHLDGRAVSNEATAEVVRITVSHGVLTAVFTTPPVPVPTRPNIPPSTPPTTENPT